MITFFQPPTPPANANLSPFCAKLDMIMQLSGLNVEYQMVMDPREGPKQKVPFIKDGDQAIGDTQFIEAHLKAKHGIDLLAHLSKTDQAIGRMIMSTVEEQLYFALVYSRWQIDANWPIMENIFFSHMPEGIRQEVATNARTMIKNALHGQGIGRHSVEEVYTLGMRIIDDLSTLLGERDYFLSDKPTSIDASVYGCLINMIQNPVPTPFADHVKSRGNLCVYLDRVSSQFFANAARALPAAA